MARARGHPGDGGSGAGGGDPYRLPPELRSALPPDAVRTWAVLAPHLPDALYLGGGAAAALRLHHRVSQDLDFFYHREAIDLEELEQSLTALGFAASHRAPGTLRGVLGATKIEFLHADQVRAHRLLEAPDTIGGLRVAGLKDLMAMKLKVLAERGELRDYYDVMRIEQDGGISVEDGIAYFLERHGLDRASAALTHLVRALGHLDDAGEDDAVPMSKAELTDWWGRRQARVVANLGR